MKIIQGILTNWKTTLGGIAALLIALGVLGTALKLAATGDFAGAYALASSPEGIPGIIAAVVGVIALFCRDADKTSQQSGAK